MKNIFKKILFGNIAITEYSTITIKGDIKEQVYLRTEKNIINVSRNQWVLCLEPIVFGVWIAKDKKVTIPDEETEFKIYFKDASDRDSTRVAILAVDLLDTIEEK